MSSLQEVLVIDDEPQIRKLLEITLLSNNYLVTQASTAKDGLIMAENHPPDMILLDLGLPDEDGHSVLQKLRQWYTNPVIIISVIQDERDIIKALDNGANDYLIKPFRTGELLARIRSALRDTLNELDSPVYTNKGLHIDLAARIVKKDNELLKLTATEFHLLSVFVKNEGKVVTHQYLLREVWGPGFIHQSQYLRVFVAQLRKKIEKDANRPEFITTESGVGYRFISRE